MKTLGEMRVRLEFIPNPSTITEITEIVEVKKFCANKIDELEDTRKHKLNVAQESDIDEVQQMKLDEMERLTNEAQTRFEEASAAYTKLLTFAV